MIDPQQQKDIFTLAKAGFSVPTIANQSKVSMTTIYRLLKQKDTGSMQTNHSSVNRKIGPYIGFLNKAIRKDITNCHKLFGEIKKFGYKGSYATVNRYVKSATKFIDRHKRSIRFETNPGEQAQVDWGSFGKIEIDGIPRRLYCFVYVLGYSRMMYAEFTVRQDLQTFEQCHVHAFEYLGIPEKILYDNVKTVVLRRERLSKTTSKIDYNPAFLDFAQHYAFQVKLCPPYWPRTKGKVEAGVKYVRNNFMHGFVVKRDVSTLTELNQKTKKWLETVANVRVHKTTREKPIDRWLKEKESLTFPTNFPAYDISHFITRNSTQDGLFQYKSNFYSVPMEFTRRKLHIKEINGYGIKSIEIYYQDKSITTHPLASGRGKTIIKDEHFKIDPPSIKEKTTKKDPKSQENKKAHLPQVMIRPLSYYAQLISKV